MGKRNKVAGTWNSFCTGHMKDNYKNATHCVHPVPVLITPEPGDQGLQDVLAWPYVWSRYRDKT